MQALSGQDDEGKDVDNAKADHEDEVVYGAMAAEASAAAQPVVTQAEHISDRRRLGSDRFSYKFQPINRWFARLSKARKLLAIEYDRRNPPPRGGRARCAVRNEGAYALPHRHRRSCSTCLLAAHAFFSSAVTPRARLYAGLGRASGNCGYQGDVQVQLRRRYRDAEREDPQGGVRALLPRGGALHGFPRSRHLEAREHMIEQARIQKDAHMAEAGVRSEELKDEWQHQRHASFKNKRQKRKCMSM